MQTSMRYKVGASKIIIKVSAELSAKRKGRNIQRDKLQGQADRSRLRSHRKRSNVPS